MTNERYREAIDTLQAWINEARTVGEVEPTAMTLATVNRSGQPSARVVLLKALDERGPVFYTNLNSRKGQEISDSRSVAACFYFTRLERQVRIEGEALTVSDSEADAYFATRHRNSQLGAWASQQSQPLPSRADLELRMDELARQYEGQEVPRPPHWSGVRIRPIAIEVWQGRAHRIHERWRYERQEQCASPQAAGDDELGQWSKTLLQP
ncbi:MAG: pyridoxamine 5'-phosphate oxidase [Lysobacterales bacterium]